MKTKLFILIAILSFWPLSVYAENLTITTYYPSPSGSYKDLSISNKVSFTTASAEDTPSINSSTVGTVTQLNILSGGDSDDSIYLGGDGSTTQGGRNGSTTGTIYLWADNI
ncbi:MAG: hypothetical protein NTY47_07905, partial [Candidatus Omnitrophica bacterium]|nr:hypothetical protein [Candidatus Omnitrophota bacterium]